jgi:hypothetical protein
VTASPEGMDATPIISEMASQIGEMAATIAILRVQLKKAETERDRLQEEHVEMARLAARVDELEREELSNAKEG